MNIHHPIFQSVQVQKKLFSTVLLLFSIPFLLICLFLILSSDRNLSSRYQEQTAVENARVRSTLYDLTTGLYNLSEGFLSDPDLITLLSDQYDAEQNARQVLDAYSGIRGILSRQTSVYTLTLYHNNPTLPDADGFVYSTSEIQNAGWYQDIQQGKSSFWRTEIVDIHGTSTCLLVLYRRIPIPLQHDFAILRIAVSWNYLNNRLTNSTLPSCVCADDGAMFFDSRRTICDGTSLPYPILFGSWNRFSGMQRIEGSSAVTELSTMQPYRTQNHLYILTFNKEAAAYIRHLRILYGCMVIISFLIPCVLLYLYTGYFSARVYLLRKAMHEASQGHDTTITSFQGHDELSETFDDMKLMIAQIQQRDTDIYQAQLRERELENQQQQIELRILTSQINPHFLYNTLETLRMKAFNEGCTDLAHAIRLLGQYLHYALESLGTSRVSLAEELSYMKIYLSIQKLRFPDRVNYSFSVDPHVDTTRCEVLPFLIQPILENSVIHGLEGIDHYGQITLRVERSPEGNLLLHIHDNGEGMDESQLSRLQGRLSADDTTDQRHIGLGNISRRIHLTYGATFGIQIESKKDIGTDVVLILPYEENDNDRIDRR